MTHISCNVPRPTVIAKFAVGSWSGPSGTYKLKLQKLDFWLNLDKKAARQMPIVAVPLLKVVRAFAVSRSVVAAPMHKFNYAKLQTQYRSTAGVRDTRS
jgi:hypothetical protein